MSKISWLAIAITFCITFILTSVMRGIAVKNGIIDRPNERSSHLLPTPRGGGLAIVATCLPLQGILLWAKMLDLRLAIVLMIGGALIAYVGFVDDRSSVSVSTRSCVHFFAAILAIVVFDGLPTLQIGSILVEPGLIGSGIAVVAIVWVLNLFNFMDGIDGIAGSEAVFVTGAGAVLGLIDGVGTNISIAALVVCGSSLGFLVWNWPPAKIFMGDVGSGYLGYVIAALALAFAVSNPVMLFVWLILGGVFFCDATVTLARRILRRQRIFDAHRSHAYQRLARKWNSHKRVTLSAWSINILWLLPNAFWCIKSPTFAPLIMIVALGPLVAFTLVAGAGHDDAAGRQLQ
jgi:Fuc2NAc and GlcNAc transferase